MSEILWAVTGEVYGQALFQTAAEQAEDKEVSRKCAVLADLEAATLARLQTLIDKYSLTYNDDEHIERGRQNGRKIIERGWQETMVLFNEAVGDDVDRMERLLDNAPEEDSGALQFLVAHEKALAFFIEQELAGSVESLSEAHKLLQET